MSKTRQSDLRSFFNRTPKAENDVSKAETPSRKRNDENDVVVENDVSEVSENSSSKLPFTSSAKRRRVIISSDEEDDFKSAVSQTTPKSSRTVGGGKENRVTFVEDDDTVIANSRDSEKLTPRGQRRPPTTPKSGVMAHSFINSFRFDELKNEEVSGRLLASSEKPVEKASHDSEVESRFAHLDYDFLKPEKIRDVCGRSLTDPNYDPKTLYVPDAFLRQQTPAITQWWKFKSEHFDTILFFKVGKFYELYHMDAVAAVEALNLTYMRGGKHAHCGFPEIGYGRFADQMVNRGYKVARIEQTETPQQLEERCRRTNVREKVVRREVCRLTTFATRTYGILDGTDERETDGVTEPETNYLMAITERNSDDTNSYSNFGVCFVDCSTGKFYLSQFSDDSNFTSLRTLIAHNHPSQLLFEKDTLTQKTTALLNTLLVGIPQQALFPDREFWGAEKTLTNLNNSIYFAGNWPNVFVELGMLEKKSDAEEEIPTPCAEYLLAFSALGAVVWYLKECKIDVDLLTMRNFEIYVPANIAATVAACSGISTKGAADGISANSYWNNRNMVLDGTSLLNLHVLPEHTLSRRSVCNGAFDTSLQKFSLFNTVNHCATSFGRRLLQRWMCLPSCDARVLRDRQDAVRTITSDWQSYGTPFIDMLRKVPDMERLFQRIHILGLKHRAVDHPDARAQMFDLTRYNQRKIKDLVLALDGLDMIAKIQTTFSMHGLTGKSALLDQCMKEKNEEMICDLNYFKRAFDRDTALQDGVIVPSHGVDSEYDEAKNSLCECERVLDDYLEKQRAALKCISIKYLGGKANYYHMEMPDSACSKMSSDYTFISQRKGFKRYTTKDLEDLKARLSEAQRKLNVASDEVTRKVFSDFDERKQKWHKVVENIAIFDCILSLAHYAEYTGLKMCFPQFVFDALEPFLEIRAGYHPALLSSRASGSSSAADNASTNYIPNDCILGGNSQIDDGGDASTKSVDVRKPVMLLTGPNMGGKSTLMRQISSLVILAQMGSMVPADSMRLTPVDRIFCRIGASDRLTAGQSTFFVELLETNVILREATPYSLVLVDELGRGTSTYDGTAIAFAVLKQIASKISCRTIFSTHYHALCRMVRDNELASGFMNQIKLAHMACMAENETNDPTEENITFLYTLSDGPASKSYGFYTAKVAGIDKDVVRRALIASNRLKSC